MLSQKFVKLFVSLLFRFSINLKKIMKKKVKEEYQEYIYVQKLFIESHFIQRTNLNVSPHLCTWRHG